MEALRTAEDATARDRYSETFAQLTEECAEAERARTLAALYASAVLPQARAAVDAALSAYRVGQVEFTTLVESEMTVNNYEIELVRLAAQYHGAVARVVALIGLDLGDLP
jgi:outer membrane protein TolC